MTLHHCFCFPLPPSPLGDPFYQIGTNFFSTESRQGVRSEYHGGHHCA